MAWDLKINKCLIKSKMQNLIMRQWDCLNYHDIIMLDKCHMDGIL